MDFNNLNTHLKPSTLKNRHFSLASSVSVVVVVFAEIDETKDRRWCRRFKVLDFRIMFNSERKVRLQK